MISALTPEMVENQTASSRGIDVRKATMQDIPPLLELINGYAARGIMLPRTEFEMSENMRDFMVAYDGNHLVGCGAMHFYSPTMGEVRSLAVAESHKTHGIGRLIVDSLIYEAKLYGLDAVFAFTYVPGFFAKVGFNEVERGELPLKAWKDCLRCPKFHACDEIAVLRELRPHRRGHATVLPPVLGVDDGLVVLLPHRPGLKMAALALAVRALRSRNYRLFFGGQSISLIGTWMTRIATSWLVYRLTGSAALLGAVGFANFIPTFVLGPVAGVWVDRWNRHRTIVITQILSMMQSLALAVLTLSGIITIWEVMVLAVLQGVINAFDMPARQSFVVEMVEHREDLGNAIALNSSMVNAARLLGPAIGGVVIAAVGEGYCFLIDGLSYIAVIVSLMLMGLAPAAPRKASRHVMTELNEGWRYILGSVPIRSILLNLGLVSLVGMPYTVLMPIFASQILHGGPHTLGFLMASSGTGALIGTVILAMRKSVVGLGRRIAISTALLGGALIAFGFSQWTWLSMLILLVVGYGMMQQMASSNTILQTIVEDEKRGRVMSFYAVALQGMAPFGSLFGGALAARIGAPRTVMVSGVLCLAGSLWFALKLPSIRKVVRPIYIRMGFLPDTPG